MHFNPDKHDARSGLTAYMCVCVGLYEGVYGYVARSMTDLASAGGTHTFGSQSHVGKSTRFNVLSAFVCVCSCTCELVRVCHVLFTLTKAICKQCEQVPGAMCWQKQQDECQLQFQPPQLQFQPQFQCHAPQLRLVFWSISTWKPGLAFATDAAIKSANYFDLNRFAALSLTHSTQFPKNWLSNNSVLSIHTRIEKNSAGNWHCVTCIQNSIRQSLRWAFATGTLSANQLLLG